LLANAVACFLAQDYPATARELIILDDAGDHADQQGPGWRLVSIARRFPTLPEKFNALASLARGEIFVVWEDDDIYLPWHLSSHVAALTHGQFSKPSRVLSLYTGRPEVEAGTYRFHGSLALTRRAFEAVGGWPVTRRADFDLQMIDRLAAYEPPVDPCEAAPPAYVFRWLSTRAYHGQFRMRSPADETWYDRCRQPRPSPSQPLGELNPQFDEETLAIMRSHANEPFACLTR
jgi:hypothetical protein